MPYGAIGIYSGQATEASTTDFGDGLPIIGRHADFAILGSELGKRTELCLTWHRPYVRQPQQSLEGTRPFFGCRGAVETEAANPGDHGSSFQQLDVGLVLARNMWVLEEYDPTTTTIKDFLGNFGIAA
jgi:hypothetical protein